LRPRAESVLRRLEHLAEEDLWLVTAARSGPTVGAGDADGAGCPEQMARSRRICRGRGPSAVDDEFRAWGIGRRVENPFFPEGGAREEEGEPVLAVPFLGSEWRGRGDNFGLS